MDVTAWATVWVFLSLLVFIGGMIYLKIPGRITSALDARAEGIRNELDEARRLREEAQALLAEYQRRKQQAETEAHDIIDLAKREAAALTGEAKARMEEYVVRRERAVEQRIAQAEAQAVTEVRSRAVDVAAAAAAQMISDRGDTDEANKIVNDAIAGLKGNLN